MSFTGKPLWLEGMFLRAQHLQQYDRWIESNLEQRVVGLTPYPWGLRSLRVDPEALKTGQVQISEVEVVFPDGTLYAAPSAHVLPTARKITSEHQGGKIWLALPLRGVGGLEVTENNGFDHRFKKASTGARNNAQSDRPAIDIFVGSLNVRIVLEGEPLDELVAVQIAEVEAVDSHGLVTLSQSYIPPVLTSGASVRLGAIMGEIRGLLRSRAGVLASGAIGQGGVDRAGMLDLMTLGIVNRYETLFTHMMTAALHAPELVYRECIGLVGELSAYAASGRRPAALPPYNHVDLRGSFDPIVAILRSLLSVVVERNAVSIPISERNYGIWLGEIQDRMLFIGRRFVLIAQADIALETIRSQMPIQIKVGPVEQIRELVNLQLPGIAVSALSVAPREIPFIQNAVYFELDTGNRLWSQFQESSAFALHVSGNYPGLRLELWAIQKSE